MGMYISELFNRGCRIVYKRDPTRPKPYWGVSTMEKLVMLYNVSPLEEKDIPTIEDMLYQADRAYKGVKLRED